MTWTRQQRHHERARRAAETAAAAKPLYPYHVINITRDTIPFRKRERAAFLYTQKDLLEDILAGRCIQCGRSTEGKVCEDCLA